MKYEPGKTTPCDYGSRHPAAQETLTKEQREQWGVEQEEEDCEIFVQRLVVEQMPEAVTLKELQEALQADEHMRQLMEDVKKGQLRKEMHK